MRICTQTANLYQTASLHAENTSQGLYGEQVQVIEQSLHFSKIRLDNDGYTGFVENGNLHHSQSANTHRVMSRSTPLFEKTHIKSHFHTMLLFGSELILDESPHKNFMQTDDGLFVWKTHVQPLQQNLTGSLVNTAEHYFLGSPYVWGGRSTLGLDCSALVQLSAMLHGMPIPRDTKDQVPFFQNPHNSVATPIDYEHRQCDDLLYWPGHVAIVRDEHTVVHATAHSLSCCIEALASIEQRAGRPTSIWRLQQPT